MTIENVNVFSGIHSARNEQDVLLSVLRHTTSDCKFFATSSRIRARTIDGDKNQCRKFVKHRREHR